jgi:CRP-like cAMP-binding protein
VLVLPEANLLNLSGADQELVKEGFLHAAVDQVNRLTQQVSDLYCPLPQRVAKVLLALADQAGHPSTDGGIRISLRLRQQDLAELAGGTRVSVNQAMRSMERRGWIERTGDKDLILLKPDQLEEYASR